MLFLIIIYIFIILFQIVFTKYNISKKTGYQTADEVQVKFNIDNQNVLDEKINNKLLEYVDLLESGKINYDDWLKYINDNILLEINGYKYYILLHEKMPNNSFIVRAHGQPKYVNYAWSDAVKLSNDVLAATDYSTDINVVLKAYYLAKDKKIPEKIKYYWLDPLSQEIVEKESITKRWDDPKTGRTGIIAIGKTTELVENKEDFFQLFNINRYILAIISFSTLILSSLIYYLEGETKKSSAKSIFLLITLNLYLLYFINKQEGLSSFEGELDKFEEITNGILSISFLTGINVFILNSLSKNYKKTLFIESAIFFSLSMILLLLSSLKNMNYKILNDVITQRVSKQLVFNYSVILNTFILLNFIIYSLSIKFKNIKLM